MINTPEGFKQKGDIYTNSIDTPDFFATCCEYSGELLTICITLKRDSGIRKAIFDFMINTEAGEKGLVGYNSKMYSIEDWVVPHILIKKPLEEDEDATRTSNFITAGIQVRFMSAINQGKQVEINKRKRGAKHPLDFF